MSIKINVYIPKSEKHTVSDLVKESIRKCGDIVGDIFICETLATNRQKCVNEANSRNLCNLLASKHGDEYYIINDSDIVVIDNNSFYQMFDYINSGKSDAVALLRDECTDRYYNTHIQLGCVMYRKECLSVPYRYTIGGCLCEGYMKDLKDNGLKIAYLDKQIRIRELE